MALITTDPDKDEGKSGKDTVDSIYGFGDATFEIEYEGYKMDDVTLEDVSIDAEEIVDELEETRKHNFMGPKSNEEKKVADISGVSRKKATRLREAGYGSIEEIREAEQHELADVRSIGNALAARIKADVGKVEKCKPVVDSPEFLDEDTLMVNMR
jgi:large subunit ribosomal protein L32e